MTPAARKEVGVEDYIFTLYFKPTMVLSVNGIELLSSGKLLLIFKETF